MLIFSRNIRSTYYTHIRPTKRFAERQFLKKFHKSEFFVFINIFYSIRAKDRLLWWDAETDVRLQTDNQYCSTHKYHEKTRFPGKLAQGTFYDHRRVAETFECGPSVPVLPRRMFQTRSHSDHRQQVWPVAQQDLSRSSDS